jgi:hypothetical protein
LLSEIGDPEVDSPEHRLDLMQRLIQARIASGDPRTYRVPEALEKYRGELAATAAHQATLSAADEKYKLTEYCVIPNKTYEVVGTCAENPQRTGSTDARVILKAREGSTLEFARRRSMRQKRCAIRR